MTEIAPGGPTRAACPFRSAPDALEDLDGLTIGAILNQLQVALDQLRALGTLGHPCASQGHGI
jgi:hypothetical protein